MNSGDKTIVWLTAIVVMAGVLLGGDPDLVDRIGSAIPDQTACEVRDE